MSTPAAGQAAWADSLDAVAIIGMAGRFPGADGVQEFWRNLRDGVESISPVSEQDMLDAGVDPASLHDPRRVAVASTLDDFEYFDGDFFGFSPRQAELTDPQQRLFLECAWDALENAGCDPATADATIGVFAGSSLSTYLLFHLYPSIASVNTSSNLQVLIGNDKDYLATQVAYKLGLRGPAVNVQTACSTSLVAVHLAAQSLVNRECDIALAGGVTVRLPARAGYLHEVGGILSPDGHCRPFDAAAQGTVFGSGGAIVVLKRLTDALADGDVIDAVIRGSAINNDGSLKAGFTAPSEDGQAEVVAQALAMADVDADTIGYVEMHGTGTALGDPIEVAALTRAFRARDHARPTAPGSCAIGAVKSNVGHLESAAGVTALVKTVLALTNRQIPPTLHYTRPNQAIDFSQTPFYVNTRLTPWLAGGKPRRAGVSSYGIGGTNAHVVLEEAPAAVPEPPAEQSGAGRPYLLPLSARDPAALAALALRYRDFLAEAPPGGEPALRDVCWSASTRRRHHQHRLTAVGHSRAELVAQLAAVSSEQAAPAPVTPSGHRGKLVFVFPGQGSQWTGMGRQLLAREPVFRAVVQRCDEVISRHVGWSLLAELSRDDGDQSWSEQTDRVQLASFAVHVGLAAWWRSLGIEPDAVVGHSMGEIAAAHVAGALSLDDAVGILCHRNRLIHPSLGRGRMMMVGLTPDEARELLAGQDAQASVAIVNSPTSTVLSGDPGVLESVAARLQSRGTFHRWINVDFASHSPQMDPFVEPLREALGDLSGRQAIVPIISTVTGNPIEGPRLDAEYWARNLREPVLFADATRWLRDHDHDTFVEISAHPILLPSIEDSLFHLDRPGTVVPSLRHDSDEQQSLLESLGALYRAGHAIRWEALYSAPGRYVRLPAYPWQRRRYWVNPPRPGRARAEPDDHGTVHPLVGRRLRSALTDVQLESDVGLSTLPYLDDHRVCGRAVFPAAGYLEMLWQGAASWEPGPHELTDVVMHDLLSFADDTPHLLQTILTPTGDGGGRLKVFSWEADASVWQPHVSARVRSLPAGDEAPAPDLNEVRDRCLHEIRPLAYYDRLRQEGLEYGPRFRGIESLRVGEGEAIGQVQLPETLTGEAASYGVHPALLDACLQLMGAALAGDYSGVGADAGGLVYLPVEVTSFHVVTPGQALVTAHAVVHDDPGGGPKTCDVRLYGERGRLVAEVTGLRVKPVGRSALRRAFQAQRTDWSYELRWRQQPRCESLAGRPARSPEDRPSRWLILADETGVGQALADQLEQRGDAVNVVRAAAPDRRPEGARPTALVDPMNPTDFTALLARNGGPYRGVIYLWGMDATPAELTTAESLASDEGLICGGALHLVQALVRQPWVGSSRLWLVTCGCQLPGPSAAPFAPAQAPLWGLGRTLAVEHPELRCARVDLDTVGVDDNVRTLLAEADATGQDDRSGRDRQGQEDQVAFRHGERFVARLVRSSEPTRPGGARTPTAGQSRQLVIGSRGNLDALTFEATRRRAPAAGEVEIRVRAAGLNFRDVLNALGAYPGAPGPLGLECAGEVSALGAGVEEFSVGDAVVGLAPGCFGTFVTVPAVLVADKPETMSYAEAATIPIAFMTAYYGLCHLARIARGDRILIHSAAGGLGLAATQLALRAGAEVFATAGTEAKRTYLRSLGVDHVMPSRTLDFAAEVTASTEGQGVDIVLNALTGEYIPRNLSVLAPAGRFVEVGKIGVWDSDQVKQVRPDASYFVLDLGEEVGRNPDLIGGMLRDLMREFAAGMLRPLPRHVFPMPQATDAFRLMTKARHLGKIVLTQEVGLSDVAEDRFRPDASYLISGGLGALGQQVARWMVERGARNLALVGRSGPSVEAQAVVDELTAAGAQVLLIGADVARPEEVTRALATISDALPPLRGIVHAAGVLDDGIALHQDWARFARVLAPKVQGTWNLHAQTRGAALDFFVLFSSVAAIWGSAGQSSYAAANAFLDALAHARRAQGLPALSINWGGWSQVGLASGDEVSGRMTGHGMKAITPDAGVVALEHAMRQQAAQVAVVPIDWPVFLARFPVDRVPSLLAEMSRESRRRPGDQQPSPGQSDLLQRLTEAGADNRRRVLSDYLVEQAKLALGLDAQATLDPRRPLNELGLDSLMAIEMRSKLGRAVGHPLPATILFDYPTVEGLVGYLAGEVLNLPSDRARDGRGSTNGHAPPPPDVRDIRAPAMAPAGSTEGDVSADLADELAAVAVVLKGDQR